MQNSRFNLIVLSSVFVALSAGPAMAQPSDDVCASGGGPTLCVRFDNVAIAPVPLNDFDFDFSDPNNPSVDLTNGTAGATLLEWRVWSKDGSGDPANMGSLTAGGADDYHVMLRNPSGGSGAVNVARIDLDPSDASKFSNVAGGITGTLGGELFLQETTGGSGGELGSMFIGGDVNGPVTIPKTIGIVVFNGETTQNVTIGEITTNNFTIRNFSGPLLKVTEGINGVYFYVNTVPVGSTIEIEAVTAGATVELGHFYPYFSGTLKLVTGLTEANTLVDIWNFPTGEVDLNGGPVAGLLKLRGNVGGDIINGGAVTGEVVLGTVVGEAFSGTATFDSIGPGAFVGPSNNCDLAGSIIVNDDVHDGSGIVVSDMLAGAQIEVGGAVRDSYVAALDVTGGDIDLGSLEGGELRIFGPVSSALSVFSIGDMISSASNPSQIDFYGDFGGTLYLGTGIKVDQQVDLHGEFLKGGVINLNNQGVAGVLELDDGGSGTIANGGSVSGTVTLADGAGDSYSGSATFDSVTTGTIQTLNGGNLSGALTITNNVADDCNITGAVSGSISIGGNLSAVLGIGGDLSEDVEIDGDMIGSVTVGGELANAGLGGGRIMVAGETSGAIQVGEKTASLTLIQLVGGLAAGGTIEINTTEGNFDAEGDICIGQLTQLPLPPVTFDGCIRIYDYSGFPPAGGSLRGDCDIVGCHNPGDLNICVDGSDNGNINIEQGGCTNQVDWSCGGCP